MPCHLTDRLTPVSCLWPLLHAHCYLRWVNPSLSPLTLDSCHPCFSLPPTLCRAPPSPTRPQTPRWPACLSWVGRSGSSTSWLGSCWRNWRWPWNLRLRGEHRPCPPPGGRKVQVLHLLHPEHLTVPQGIPAAQESHQCCPQPALWPWCWPPLCWGHREGPCGWAVPTTAVARPGHTAAATRLCWWVDHDRMVSYNLGAWLTHKAQVRKGGRAHLGVKHGIRVNRLDSSAGAGPQASY